jgi:hypothetical protein
MLIGPDTQTGESLPATNLLPFIIPRGDSSITLLLSQLCVPVEIASTWP